MVRYLKLIVLVFGGLGLMIGSFFFFQNKNDIKQAWSFEDKVDYEVLKQNCPRGDVFPCLKKEFEIYMANVSLTGASMGMKMVFSSMDEMKFHSELSPEKFKELKYSLDYLEINNTAMEEVYQNYFGFEIFYPGYIGSLPRFYEKGFEFSENIINGLRGPEGLSQIENPMQRRDLDLRLKRVEAKYFEIKSQVNDFIENETKRLQNQS